MLFYKRVSGWCELIMALYESTLERSKKLPG